MMLGLSLRDARRVTSKVTVETDHEDGMTFNWQRSCIARIQTILSNYTRSYITIFARY